MADDARSVLADPRAPAAERFDAQAELSKGVAPSRSDLLPQDAVKEAIAYINETGAGDALMKSQVVMTGRTSAAPPKRGMQSVAVDTLQMGGGGEYVERQGHLGFHGMRQMVNQTPILNAVVMTRIRQISRFCQPSEDGGPGFEIRHVDRKHKLTGGEAKGAQLLTQWFRHCGWEFNPRARKKLGRDNFSGLMSKLVRDSLTMDACPIETEWRTDKSLGLDGLYAVDGATVRLCSEQGYEGNDKIYALQVIEGRIATTYTQDQLIYEVRNPRADVALGGYGLGETELLIRTVTGFLNAMNYNIAGFDNNAIPKGLLHLNGNYDSADLAAFKRYWNATVKGVNNAWTLPVMVSKDQESKASFEKFGVDFDEMYFAKWMTFLTSIVCSIYGMDPAEINFESFAAAKSSLSGSDTAEKLTNSKDVGLHPNMAFFEALWTDFVVAEFDPDLCFRWVGVEQEDQDKAWEAKKLILKVDELRAEQGYGPWGAEDNGVDLGAAPINPSLLAPWQASQAGLQPPEPEEPQGPDFGEEPGQGGDAGEPGKQPIKDKSQQDEGGDFGGKKQGDFGGGTGGAKATPSDQAAMAKAFPTIYAVGEP